MFTTGDLEDVRDCVDQWGQPIPKVTRSGQNPIFWVAMAVVAVAITLIAAYVVFRHFRIRWLAVSCQEAFRANDLERVEDLAERWHGWQPHKAAPLVYLAEVANQAQQHERAIELLDQLPDDDRMTPAALLERSSMLFGPLNRPIEGAETLERLLKLAPKHVEARRRLVYFYAFTLQRQKMVRHAYEAIAHDCDLPETYVYLMLRDSLSFGNAYDQNTTWSRGAPDEELFLVARAIYRIRGRALDDSIDAQTDGPPDPDGTPYHRKVIAEHFQRFPHNLELTAYYVDRSIANGNAEEAARLLSGAPPEAADDNRFWRFRGWLHSVLGELAEAEDCYQKALSLNAYDHLARHQLASVVRRMRRLDRVKPLEDLSFEGKALRSQLYKLPTVDKVPVPLMRRMADYAQKCGDFVVAQKLRLRADQVTAAAAAEKR